MNKIILICADHSEKEVDKVNGISIRWFGSNSTVKIHENTQFKNCIFEVGDNNIISIGAGGIVFGLYIRMLASESKVLIGRNFIISGGEFILANKHKKQTITIGDDCLFSAKIAFFTSDGHTLLDNTTGKILNDHNGSITIGNHVWVGYDVCILKNAYVADDSMIGAKSLVNKIFKSTNLLISGNPAQVIRENINWSIQSPNEYKTRK